MRSSVRQNISLLILSLLLWAGSAHSHDRILGGQFYNLFDSPVALIATSSYLCSGVLVGQREILTAAHCISAEADDYLVAVGGDFFAVTQALHNPQYEPRGDIFRNMAHDTGMLILDRPVAINPIPVLTDLPLERGQLFLSYGYGTNELSGTSGKSIFENGKGAGMSISAMIPGFFQSSYVNDKAAICSGDSGGPAVMQLGESLVVIGVNSAGSTKDLKGNCEVGGGESLFVDLQARSSVQFLANFSGIQTISGRLILLQDQLNALLHSAEMLLQEDGSSRSLRKMIARAQKQVRKTLPLASGLQAKELKRTERLLSKAKGQVGSPQQQRLLNRVYAKVRILLSLESY